DESGGISAADSSGNGNTGTLTASNASFVAGKINNAVSLTHTGTTSGGLVNIANPSNFNFDYNQPFSLSAWVYRTSNANENDIVEKEDPSNGYIGYGILFNPGSNSLYAEVQKSSSTGIQVSTTAGLSTGTWHHVVMTYDGSHVASGLKLYVDGSSAAFTVNNDTLGPNTIQNTMPLQIGGSGDGDGSTDAGCCTFGGNIDDVRVFNRVLTEADVRVLYGQ
ncbi:MAG TPA: LamG domain-containing protein, partial [Puia sp.]|nr:LamG domain-containing protein [Puia sp.]